jgi:hypothetical protein
MRIRYLSQLLLILLSLSPLAIADQRGPAVPDYHADKIADGVYVIHGPLGVPSLENQGIINNSGFVHRAFLIAVRQSTRDISTRGGESLP